MLIDQPVLLGTIFLAVIIATVRDLQIREVPDMVSYGLITIGLLFGILRALFANDLTILLSHLAGLALGAGIGLLLYVTRQWGGGDAKLLMGIGATIGFWSDNWALPLFVVLLLFCGALYGIIWTASLAIIHRKQFIKEFIATLRTPSVHRIRITLLGTAVLFLIAIFFVSMTIKLILASLIATFYVLTYSWIAVKAIERHIMTKPYPVARLTEGDWLSEDIYQRKKILVRRGGTGLTLEQIALLKKAKIKTVLVREGIPFVPAFLMALSALTVLDTTVGISTVFAMLLG